MPFLLRTMCNEAPESKISFLTGLVVTTLLIALTRCPPPLLRGRRLEDKLVSSLWELGTELKFLRTERKLVELDRSLVKFVLQIAGLTKERREVDDDEDDDDVVPKGP